MGILKDGIIVVFPQIDFSTLGAYPHAEFESMLPIWVKALSTHPTCIVIEAQFSTKAPFFVDNHFWRQPGQTVTVDGVAHELQLFHCIEGTFGAGLHPQIPKFVQKITLSELPFNGEALLSQIKKIGTSQQVNEWIVMGIEAHGLKSYLHKNLEQNQRAETL